MTKSENSTRNTYVQSIDEAGALVEKYGKSHDVFVGLATSTSESGQSDSIYRRQTLMVDYDKKDYPAFSSYKDFINLFKQNAGQLYYHGITDTGGGFHIYIGIEPTSDCQRVAALNRALAELVGADPKAALATQLDRIPTTLNHKYTPLEQVNVIVNDFGTPRYKPYSLNQIERFISKGNLRKELDALIQQCPPTECNSVKAFYCAESMIANGAIQGERNFCLGRICNFLRDIRGCTQNAAYKTVQAYNSHCTPPKAESELHSQFDRYWSNAEYRLLGCSLNDVSKSNILNKYCDRSLCNNNTVLTYSVEEAPPILMSNRILRREDFKRLRGNHYLILTLLHYRRDGLTKKELVHELTPRKGRTIICRNTLSAILDDLFQWRYIDYDNNRKRYVLKSIAGFNKGSTQYYYTATVTRINGIISQQEYLVYLALRKQLQANESASYEKLSYLTGIDASNISKYINGLENAHMLRIGKWQMENGQFCNSYQLRC